MYSTFSEFSCFVSHWGKQACASSTIKTQAGLQELLISYLNLRLFCLFLFCFPYVSIVGRARPTSGLLSGLQYYFTFALLALSYMVSKELWHGHQELGCWHFVGSTKDLGSPALEAIAIMLEMPCLFHQH